jgi:hypothetical protein
MIYALSDSLQLQSDGSALPPLLTAAADKVPYPEAKEVYQRINTSINLILQQVNHHVCKRKIPH